MAAQKGHQKPVFKTDYRLMQVKIIAGEHSAIVLTFIIYKLPFVIKTFVLSIFEWPLKAGFTVFACWEILIFFSILSSADFFSKFTFSNNSFRDTIKVSSSLDPDQATHSVWPDQDSTVCKGYQQMTLVGIELTLCMVGNF